MVPLFFLLVSGWLFYRLAWSYNKNGWKFALIGITIYAVLLFIVSYVLSFWASIDTGASVSQFLLIHLQLLFNFGFDLIIIGYTLIPVAVIFFIVYKAIEYRWKQQEKSKSKELELLDN